MTNKPQIRIAFNSHGLGDVVHCIHAMKLYQSRGYNVVIEIEPNKMWAWNAAGIPIHHGESLPIHPYHYPSDFFDLSKPDHTHSKIAHLFEVAELPKLGTKAEVWQAICETEIDATHAVSSRAMDDATKFLEGLPKPIILLHSKGTNWQEKKSIPDGVAFQLIRELLDTGGSVVTLDWDGRAPTLGHERVRGIKPNWHHISLEEFGALCILSDLLIGVDSGPFHLAGWFDIPTLYVSREIPPVRCCLPSPMATYLVPAKDHEHWLARGPEWRFLEFQGSEATAGDIACVASAILNGGQDKVVVTAKDLIPMDEQDELDAATIPGRYTYKRVGHDERPMDLLADGKIGEGAAGCEQSWKIEETPIGRVLTIAGDGGRPTCHLQPRHDGVLCGRWLRHERMPIELVRQTEPTADGSLRRHWTDQEVIAEPKRPTVVIHNGLDIHPEDVPDKYLYRRIGVDERQLELKADGTIGEGNGDCERVWVVEPTPFGAVLTIYGDHGGPTCHLSLMSDGVFRGRWLAHEQMPIELIRQAASDSTLPSMPPDVGVKTVASICAPIGHPSDALPDAEPNFYFGILTYNCFDLLNVALEAVLKSTAMPKKIYVLDNSGGKWQGHPSRRVEIIRAPYNLGYARGCNVLLNLTQPAPMIIGADDIEVSPDLFENMLTCPAPIVFGNGAQAFTVHLIRAEAWNKIGPFDGEFYPAYHEDNDYAMRAHLAGVVTECPRSSGYVNHGPSATKAAMSEAERSALNGWFGKGRARYVAKWGGPPHLETFTVPFNGVPQQC